MRTAILPFMFFFNPKLLLYDVTNWWAQIWVLLTALIGMLGFVSATQGYFTGRLSWYERIALLAGSLLLIKPGNLSDGVGFALVALVYFWQRWRAGRGGPLAGAPVGT